MTYVFSCSSGAQGSKELKNKNPKKNLPLIVLSLYLQSSKQRNLNKRCGSSVG
jgi:hypothetical protein